MKRIIGLVLLTLVLCVAVIVVYFASGKTLEMNISKQEVQTSVDRLFPVNRGVVKFDLNNSRINCLPKDNRVSVSGDIKINVLGMINATGTCRISGIPQYNLVGQSILFREIRIEQLALDGMPDKMQEQVQQLADKAIFTFLADYPFYKFDQKKWFQKFIGGHVRGVTVAEDGLVLTLGW